VENIYNQHYPLGYCGWPCNVLLAEVVW